MELRKHQQPAYEIVKHAYEVKNKALVVFPTGCGKSFIALQLMEDNKDKTILFMAPTNVIKNQMYNYIAKYIVGEEPSGNRPARRIASEYFPKLQIRLYPSLLRVSDEQIEKLNADFIILDELHRTGADKWGKKINTLIEKNKNAKILGLTATPDRMDDKNIVDELFDGNVDYELTLVKALRDGIVKAPTYVKCDYALRDYLIGIKNAISNCDDEQTRKKLQEKYEHMRKIVEHADGIPELFEKNINKKDGKYIVFCKDKEHMDELIKKSKEWFGSIDEEPEIYSVYSGEGYSEATNRKSIHNFEKSKSEHIKLLYSIEMLNEGLHVEDVSGVIMARPTDSRIIYLQQLGRALSSNKSNDKPIVFDLVNNYVKNNLDAEVNKRTNVSRNTDRQSGNVEIYGIENEIEDIDCFRVQGETLEFLELLKEAQEIISRSGYLANVMEIKEWLEKKEYIKFPSSKSENEEEKRLGVAWISINGNLIKPYLDLQTEDEKEKFKEKHPETDEVLKIVDEINLNKRVHLRNAKAIKKWVEKTGSIKPPYNKSLDEEEKRLGIAWVGIRNRLINPYLKLQTEEEKEKYKKDNPEIDDVIEIVNEIKSKKVPAYLRNARTIKDWIEKSGDTKPPRQTPENDEECKNGKMLADIRSKLTNPYLKLQTDEEREEFRKDHPEIDEVIRIVNEIDSNNISSYLTNARRIKEWIDKSGNTKPPSSTSLNEEEKKNGRNLSNIRENLKKPYERLQTEEEREEFRKKYPEIDEVLEIVNEIDKNNIPIYLKNARELKIWVEETGNIRLPSTKSENDEEKKKGNALRYIRSYLIKPYLEMNTEEREEFRKDHPEIDEVLRIISELDMQCGTKKQKELACLIKVDLEKRQALFEARKLEQEYEQQLSVKNKKQYDANENRGVDLDGK